MAGCCEMSTDRFIFINAIMLTIALFVERYCFIMICYKTRCYNYVLILVVVFINCAFNGCRKIFADKQKRNAQALNGVYVSGGKKTTMHEAFNIDRPHQVGVCIIILVGLLDMVYVFLLFWSANEFPIWLMVSLLQLFIPLNMLIRSGFMGL